MWQEVTHATESHRPPREGAATNLSWFRGLKAGKRPTTSAQYRGQLMQPKVSRDGFVTPSLPLTKAYARPGYEDCAPRLVKAREVGATGKTEVLTVHRTKLAVEYFGLSKTVTLVKDVPIPDMPDFGAATDRQERNLEAYRQMSPEERAEWLYSRENAPYEPPMRREDAARFYRLKAGARPDAGPKGWVPVW